jgi:hypothetical protein
MKRWLASLICLFIIVGSGLLSRAQENQDKVQVADQSEAEAVPVDPAVTEEDREMIGALEMLELMELLEEMDFIQEVDLFMEGNTDEKEE